MVGRCDFDVRLGLGAGNRQALGKARKPVQLHYFCPQSDLMTSHLVIIGEVVLRGKSRTQKQAMHRKSFILANTRLHTKIMSPVKST